MYIDESHTGAVLAHSVVLCQERIYHLIRHTESVVAHFNIDIVSLPVSHNRNLTVAVHGLHAVIDCILK